MCVDTFSNELYFARMGLLTLAMACSASQAFAQASPATISTYVDTSSLYRVPDNQIDVFGGLAFGPRRQPFIIAPGTPPITESMAPGSGAFEEVTFHHGFTNNVVGWAVVSHTGFDWGSPGIFGSKQSANLWDFKAVIGWKGYVGDPGGWIIEYYGGVKYVSLDTTSRSAAGGRHNGGYTGFGPTLGLTLDHPLVPTTPAGVGGLMFNSYFEAAALFGTLNDTSNYGVSGSSSRTGYYTGESAGLSTKLSASTTGAITFTARQYYNVVDRNLVVGGTTASNNFNSYVISVGVKQTF